MLDKIPVRQTTRISFQMVNHSRALNPAVLFLASGTASRLLKVQRGSKLKSRTVLQRLKHSKDN